MEKDEKEEECEMIADTKSNSILSIDHPSIEEATNEEPQVK